MTRPTRIALLLFVLLTGCATQREPGVDTARAQDVMFGAMQQVGKPYRYGGSSPATGFDCSGLIQYVYRHHADLQLPRTVADMAAMDSPTVRREALTTGDLVLFRTGKGFTPDHAGIYVGQGRFVHAPSRGGKVRLDSLNESYWTNSFTKALRPLAQ